MVLGNQILFLNQRRKAHFAGVKKPEKGSLMNHEQAKIWRYEMLSPGFDHFMPLLKKSQRFVNPVLKVDMRSSSQRDEEQLVLNQITNFKSHFSQGLWA